MFFGAEIPPPEATQLGEVMKVILYLCCSLSAVVIAGAAVWALVVKHRSSPSDSEFVTRGELTREVANLKAEMSREFGRLEVQMDKLLDQEREQIQYVRQRNHDQNEKQHAINLRIHYILNIVTQLAHKANIPVPPEPVINPQHEA